MKRIILFIATNLAVMLVLSIVLSVLGVGRYIGPGGLNMGALMVFSLVVGFTGAIISLPVSYTHLPSPRDGLLSRMPSSA